jgi:ABC-type Fe3+-hydroxamate transport system substrate-binding protein
MEWCSSRASSWAMSSASSERLPVSSPTPRSRAAVLAALLLSLLLALTACGGDSPGDSATTTGSSSAAAWPVTVTGDNGKLTLDKQPESIVSMSATATEMLFAIDAGDQVKAVDSTSNYPEGVPTTDLSSFTPNAEAIAKYDPDLVVLSDDLNGIVDALKALKVPTLLLGAAQTIDDSYTQIETLGDATGHADEATKVISDMQDRIKAAVASVPGDAKGEKVYHELDPTFYSAGSSTFIGSIYSMFGLTNIADGAPDPAGGYPQLSAEYIVSQAPDLIVLADTVCCDQTAQTLASRPAFDTVPAVKNGKVLAASDDVASRWGPRVADFAESVADELKG